MAGTTPNYSIPYAESADLVSAYPALDQSGMTIIDTTLASKMSYALPTNVQTGTTYTAVLADANKLTTLNNASPIAVTIPPQSSVAWLGNTVLRYTSLGAGVVTFAGGAGVTVTNTAATVAQYGSVNLIRTGSDAWTVVPFSGGSAAATVSGTTGSPTITTVSGKTCYDFTGSGTVSIGTAGYTSVLLQGSGGGGGDGTPNGRGGGGGGGQTFIQTIYLSAGSHVISVPAGGAKQTAGSFAQVGSYIVTGGGLGNYGEWAGSYNAASGGAGSSGGGGGSGDGSAGSGGAALYGAEVGYAGQAGTTGGGGTAGGGGGSGGAPSGVTAGAGTTSSINGSSTTYGAGGNGGNFANGAGPANSGRGGSGGAAANPPSGGQAGGSGRVILLIG